VDIRRPGPVISVFGSSRITPDTPYYQQAHTLGALLAEAGFVVCNGGYDGAMGAVSRGARERGGYTIGITMDLFRNRQPNAWLSEVRRTETLFRRLEELILPADGYVVLHGGAGTLTELCLVWSLVLTRILDVRPIILLGKPWHHVLDTLVTYLDVLPGDLDVLQVTATPEDAVAALKAAIWRRKEKENK
jgi:uncharacterized protein (TIGR00730 family)